MTLSHMFNHNRWHETKFQFNLIYEFYLILKAEVLYSRKNIDDNIMGEYNTSALRIK